MPYIFGKLWHLAIIWAIRKAFQCILQGVRILLANHTWISPTSENDSYCLPEFVPFSVPRSIFYESRFQISHQNVITIFEPETNLWWSIWQFWEILLTNICNDLLFGMRYQEDVFCQPRNETFFHGFVENSLVLVLFVMVFPCNMICDIDFSFKMTHPLSRYQKCMISSLVLAVSDKSRVQRNFDGLDRLCSKVVATRGARKQN